VINAFEKNGEVKKVIPGMVNAQQIVDDYWDG
jgi:hypothetical protein